MPRVTVYDTTGTPVDEMELREDVFGVTVNEALLHQAVLRHLANQRQGTAATKNRAMVRGGGRKPWRQKGTGRARQGSIRSPLWRKGGVVFGPQPRDYRLALPRQARRQALKSALSAKVRDGEMVVLNELRLERPKTKEMANILANLKTKEALIVTANGDSNIYLSARNIEGTGVTNALGLNVYDILTHDRLVITRDAVTRVEEVLSRG
ncbi:MAG: 50S ribosomal protein L4 [Firmicutes bacterium]|nr:50S ribosomal protein L4 [Bacillota bacterium]